jgi:hypothetical protein
MFRMKDIGVVTVLAEANSSELFSDALPLATSKQIDTSVVPNAAATIKMIALGSEMRQ